MRECIGQARKTKGAFKTGQAAAGRVSDLKKYPKKAAGLRRDYSVYHLSAGEWIKYGLLYVSLDACISYLFFSSMLSFLLLLPGAAFFLKEIKKTLKKKRDQEIKHQFMDGMQMVTASLQAGYSIENSLREALKELARVYEPDSFIIREFRLMEVQIGMNRSIEELFADFARRCAIDDIQSFADIFVTAKRSGGDLIAVIRNTVSCIRQKEETVQEIETCLSGKIMEQNMMSLIPLLILAYIKLTSPEFLEVMYENILGTIVMTLCFSVYVLAYFWGRSITRIEV